MIVAGALGGMAWAAIPAFLRTRFNANEILTSLMLTYVAQLLADLSRARPVEGSGGLQLPAVAAVQRRGDRCRSWSPERAPSRRRCSRLLVVAAGLAAAAPSTLLGFQIKVVGLAPRGRALCRLRRASACLARAAARRRRCAGSPALFEVAGTDRPADAADLARLRLHRDHRRLPRPAASGRHPVRARC